MLSSLLGSLSPNIEFINLFSSVVYSTITSLGWYFDLISTPPPRSLITYFNSSFFFSECFYFFDLGLVCFCDFGEDLLEEILSGMT